MERECDDVVRYRVQPEESKHPIDIERTGGAVKQLAVHIENILQYGRRRLPEEGTNHTPVVLNERDLQDNPIHDNNTPRQQEGKGEHMVTPRAPHEISGGLMFSGHRQNQCSYVAVGMLGKSGTKNNYRISATEAA